VTDPAVERFFKGVNMTRLQAHQFDFLSLAFTQLPEGYDVAALLRVSSPRAAPRNWLASRTT
jgi:hypothetical protein